MNKLILIASTNALLIGTLLVLAGIYGAARWYLNVELGWVAWAVAIGLTTIVNAWALRRKPEQHEDK
jgi:hypothetical protein